MRVTRSLRRSLPAVVFGSAALLANPSSLAAQAAARPEPNVVKGTVRTVTGRPVAGATIRVAGATGAARGTTVRTTTDRNGNYRVKVPLGHYNVDGFADIEYDGQTYSELWLDRVSGGCERVMSDRGIVRDFVLRLSGPKKCINNPDPKNPDSYYGAYIIAMSGAFPADAVVTFTLAPLGALADGSTGRTLTFTRTGAALARGGGAAIDQTAFLHDIPLGRYRVTAVVRGADGTRRQLTLDSRDDDEPAAQAVDIEFPAAKMGGGFRSVNLGVSASGAVASGPRPESRPAPTPATPGARPAPPAPNAESAGGGLPAGRYACSYRSPYAGEIPTGNSVTIVDAGRYEAYGSAGSYTFDARSRTVRWTSGPFAASATRATFGERNGRPAITVVGGPAAEDPDRTNVCVLAS